MKNSTIGTIEMVAAMLISGTIGYFVVMSELPILNVVWFRCLLGAVTLFVICWMLGFFKRENFTKRVLLLGTISGVTVVTNWVLLFSAFSKASITIATVTYHTQPFMLVALGAIFLSEKITLNKVMWLLMAFVGMILVVQARQSGEGGSTDYLLGIAMSLGAAFLYAVTVILVKQLKGTPPHLVALMHVTVGSIVLAPLANWAIQPETTVQWTSVLALGILCTTIMYIIMYDAFQKLSTSLTGALSFVYPVAAIVVDYFAFERQLTIGQWIGSAAILFAACAMTLGWKLPWFKPATHVG
ncbi:DMT family transporter [Maritalea porphyrae]|jgi:drug/metabolite transporter (DMT)-like permease|uniref:DMT family transporter n=1 Tax=Maritalea porphyrae TaxID=880732 RepID=UPI0022AFD591|nr:DMT family transporter [Maritalea porphyrae]MCZ4271326.1 DMT family transporter [Maritalea porphyrae]